MNDIKKMVYLSPINKTERLIDELRPKLRFQNTPKQVYQNELDFKKKVNSSSVVLIQQNIQKKVLVKENVVFYSIDIK